MKSYTRGKIEFKDSKDLREALGVSPEREAEIAEQVENYSGTISEIIEKIWNDEQLADAEVIMLILGIGERLGMDIYKRKSEALVALSAVFQAGGKVH